MKVVAIVQARMGSQRLPGKILFQLGNQTILAHVIERLKRVKQINYILVATTVSVQDSATVEEAERLNIAVFRGDEQDVLSRYYHAAKQSDADIIVRITADCPFIDPLVLEDMLSAFLLLMKDQQIDYMSNCLTRSYPRGLDVEIFTMAALEKTYNEAVKCYEKEHVTPYIYSHPALFKLHHFTNKVDLSHYRLTLDTQEDWQLIETIYHKIQSQGLEVSTENILNVLMAEPALLKMNANVQQKEVVFEK